MTYKRNMLLSMARGRAVVPERYAVWISYHVDIRGTLRLQRVVDYDTSKEYLFLINPDIIRAEDDDNGNHFEQIGLCHRWYFNPYWARLYDIEVEAARKYTPEVLLEEFARIRHKLPHNGVLQLDYKTPIGCHYLFETYGVPDTPTERDLIEIENKDFTNLFGPEASRQIDTSVFTDTERYRKIFESVGGDYQHFIRNVRRI